MPFHPARRRLQDSLLYLGPLAFCLAVHWYGLWVGYHEDDWVWLGQHLRVDSFSDLWTALFTPSRHGTFRPVSERLPFLFFGALFGIDALPFRLLAFGTMFANLVLLARLLRTLTGSRIAALAGPIFWTVNAALAVAMTWCCAYMYLLCGLLLLSAFTLFLRYTRTGNRRDYLWQWLLFAGGFLVMEAIIVYPALAAAYALLFARRYLRATLPMFGASALFFALHSWYIPKQHTGPYSMHFDLSIAATFATYWKWALVPFRLAAVKAWGEAVTLPAMVALTVALAGWLVWSTWRRRMLPLFFFLCFAILLVPVLPLRSHVTDYYLTLPAMALGALLACCVADAWSARRAWRLTGAALAVLFLGVHWPVARFAARWWYLRSLRIENVVASVASVRAEEPNKTILLTDVDEVIFLGAVRDRAFAALGVGEVYLDPSSVDRLPAEEFRAAPAEFALPAALVDNLLRQDRLVVLSTAGDRVRKVTRSYAARFRASPPAESWPHRIDVGSQASASLLGDTWHVAEEGFRWMPRLATLRIGGPTAVGQRLYLAGHCPEEQARVGPLKLQVSVDALPVGSALLSSEGPFRLSFPLPDSLVARPAIEVALEVNRTFQAPADSRELGLAFTVFEVR